MSPRRRTIVALGTALLVGTLAAEPVPREIADRIGRAVQAGMEQRHIPGLAVAVVREGEVVWRGYYGLADLENDVPVSPQTVFRFGVEK